MAFALPNPLAYPAGYIPGFNPAHIAAGSCRFSAIPAPGGNFINLLYGNFSTGVFGTSQIFAPFGPAVLVPNSNPTSFSGFPAVVDASVTLAAFIYSSNLGNGSVFSTSGSSSGWGLQIASNTLKLVAIGGSTASSGLTVSNSIPYFVAASYSGGTTNFVVLNLATGKITSAVISGTLTSSASSGTYRVNTVYGIGYFNGGYIAALMYSAAGMSLAALTQWAQRPWDFWYPIRTSHALAAYVITGNPRLYIHRTQQMAA
jgi:hypothetical protein